jgi:hypothetical protein
LPPQVDDTIPAPVFKVSDVGITSNPPTKSLPLSKEIMSSPTLFFQCSREREIGHVLIGSKHLRGG